MILFLRNEINVEVVQVKKYIKIKMSLTNGFIL